MAERLVKTMGMHRIRRGIAGLLMIVIGSLPLLTTIKVQAEDSDEVIKLRISNWEEYIDQGDWSDEDAIDLDSATITSENGIIADFEDWYYETYGQKVEVEYSTFGTNEDLYSQLILGDTFDLVCPSDYMIMKLMKEQMLQPLSEGFFDTSNDYNYYAKGVSPYIEGVFNDNEINGETWGSYAAGYMWGTIGVVYNPEVVSEEDASTWSILVNPDYARQVTIKDSVRESYFPTLAIINKDTLLRDSFTSVTDYHEKLTAMMNDTSPDMIKQAEEMLQKIRGNVYSFETDSGKSDMITGKVVANLQWSGDAVYSLDQAEEDDFYLNYSVPEECTNLWFDGWVMLKSGIDRDTQKQQAAEAFINFVSRPDNAVRNMYYIGYTSAIAGGDNNLIYEYVNWLYGASEEDTDTIEYPLGYFFSGDNLDEKYILTAPAEQAKRQLLAQYPTEDIIRRSAVMGYFDDASNELINQMWINVRCFNLDQITLKNWIEAGLVILGIGILVVVFIFRHRIFIKPVKKSYRRVG